MSFTSIVKNEVSKIELNDIEKITFLSSLIQNQDINYDNIRIKTENASVARRCFSLIKELYNVTSLITVRKGYNFNKNYIYIIEISKKVPQILNNLGLEFNKQILNIPMNFIIDDIDLKRAYIMGVFLISGSINDPKKSRYHLEFTVEKEEYALFLSGLLNDFNLNSKVIRKENRYMIYIKEAEKISDFLRIINASTSLLYYEDIRIYRDHKNMTNRLNNCEQANVDKIIQASVDMINDIKLLEDNDAISLLGEKEQIVVDYRKKYPDSSLLELSEIITLETGIPITKSGINHRLKKIKLLAEKFKNRC